ncbi:single-stranded DNA-binding protein [Corynebacterium sp. HMSC062E11]|uniref:single-stranded DNA-binding protein n=1 Tax=Corynebacterium TaxID=1716 RepID=UPI0008A460E2|nr:MULTISPECIES: single-stranded DNA-binding protein [unclassified Corynebacterium]MDK6808408.1 single-stranded DNA-binding protein [Corynebacterium aurimucosum]NJJ84292.1 single-stranded DNA-binding protein [Corynebacterium aurimucosum]OFK26730.1 single-stranded DNA-binding protein [Corynebacterium sp. HMSC062E11]OFK62081.1 single-stranded DNA-binding protein [Corynebacterium sp. HMSC078A10]OFL59544.1 single-stranded DNA-binding protein [Corynebacterium sp. HMSC065D07]
MSQYPISLTGRLTHDPHLTKISETMYKARLRFASSRSVPEKDDEGKTVWRELDLNYIDGEVWGQCAINVKKSLFKGMPVFVMGSIVTDRWEDKNGAKRSRTYIKIAHVGLDLNRFCITSTKIGTSYGEEGSEALWLGENPPVLDVDYTAPPSTAEDEALPAALQSGDTPQDTAADRQQAQSAAEAHREPAPEEAMA